MEYISKPSITRLARRSGIKTLSEECYGSIRIQVQKMLEEVLTLALIVNSESNTKTLMSKDVYEAIKHMGYNMASSSTIK